MDAGYVNKEIIWKYADDAAGKTMIARMPHRKGCPYKTLYHKVKNQINRGKYAFVRAGHVYFGRRFPLTLFGMELYAYVYLIKNGPCASTAMSA